MAGMRLCLDKDKEDETKTKNKPLKLGMMKLLSLIIWNTYSDNQSEDITKYESYGTKAHQRKHLYD